MDIQLLNWAFALRMGLINWSQYLELVAHGEFRINKLPGESK